MIVTILLMVNYADGQLSPGPLAKAHAHLEGISNCLKCHVLGSKVSDQKCLDCHEHLSNRIAQKKGYHSAKEVTSKRCAECHSDHHGLEFDMIRFDQKTFDHDLTGYVLKGAHQPIDCRDCHKPDFIELPALKKRQGTFLGLSGDCLSCHTDYHQNTLDNDCLSCHSMEEFTSVPNFNHDRTDYPLRGAHQSVDCASCHEKTVRNNQDFQRFANVEHQNCTSCHNDVHQGSLGTRCTDCHSETTFNRLNGQFNHDQTGFKLEGKHRSVACLSCHESSGSLTTLFQEFRGIQATDCAHCHEDVHEGKFGTNCLDCHTVQSFRYEYDEKSFDHALTEFPLLGKHKSVNCRDCHTESLTDPVAHDACSTCHENYHKETFSETFLAMDCNSCHSEEGFSPSSFDFIDHQKTSFPLNGAHQATPCIFCHQSDNNEWQFKSLDTKCVACHGDIHKNYLDITYYPEKDCRNCHTEDTWRTIDFDHTLTGYPLEGKHAEVSCINCHEPDVNDNSNVASPVFNVSSECAQCHADNHRAQFEESGTTNCAKCHDFQNWQAQAFDHDSTRFKLDGAHLNVDCASCHYPVTDELGSYTLYKLNTLECSDCH